MNLKIYILGFFLLIFVYNCRDESPAGNAGALIEGYAVKNEKTDPGYALKIMLRDSVVLEDYAGVEDVVTKKAIDKSSLFNIGSISKTFVAYGILNLAHEKKLDLNDSLIKYFPEFKNKDIGRKVRICHLLTHSSGLPDNRPVASDSIFYLSADDEQNWAPILMNDSLHFEPGTRYEYSNPAFNALALIIQQVSGFKWQDYIKIKIFTPAQMSESTITDGEHPSKGVTHAYLQNGAQWIERDFGEEPTFNAAGNGGVWSSIEELAKYEKAIRKNDFMDTAVNRMSRTIFPLPDWKDSIPSQLGLSWFISTFAGHQVYSHTGSQGGFTADFVSIPTAGFFYCVLSNTPIQINRTRRNVLAMALEKGWVKEL